MLRSPSLPISQTPNWEGISPGLFPLLKLPHGDFRVLTSKENQGPAISGAPWPSRPKHLPACQGLQGGARQVTDDPYPPSLACFKFISCPQYLHS